MGGVVFTRGAMRALREPLERFGCGGAFTLARQGPGFGWPRCDLVDRLGQPQCNMMQSHRNPRMASW